MSSFAVRTTLAGVNGQATDAIRVKALARRTLSGAISDVGLEPWRRDAHDTMG